MSESEQLFVETVNNLAKAINNLSNAIIVAADGMAGDEGIQDEPQTYLNQRADSAPDA